MFDPERYRDLYKKFLGPLSRPVTLLQNVGGLFVGYNVNAHVTAYSESDLVPNASIQLGDLKLLIMREDLDALGLDKLELKDRINIDDRAYSIIHWDDYTRTVGSTGVAVEVTVRGGGAAVVPSVSVYRVIDNGDRRITGNGDYRVIKEPA